jgi:hypothetical protein
MKVVLVVLYLQWISICTSLSQQLPLNIQSNNREADTRVERIAIVSAGIGGASAAFNKHEWNVNLPPQSITIFESKSTVGGRIQSAYLYPLEVGRKTIEHGATHFFIDDWCITSASQQVGLKSRSTTDFGWIPSDDNDGSRTNLDCNAESWKMEVWRVMGLTSFLRSACS